MTTLCKSDPQLNPDQKKIIKDIIRTMGKI